MATRLLGLRVRMPSPVTERCKARVCGRSNAGAAGSNPVRCRDVCVVCRGISDMRTEDVKVHNG